MLLFEFVIRMYHETRSSELQIRLYLSNEKFYSFSVMFLICNYSTFRRYVVPKLSVNL